MDDKSLSTTGTVYMAFAVNFINKFVIFTNDVYFTEEDVEDLPSDVESDFEDDDSESDSD